MGLPGTDADHSYHQRRTQPGTTMDFHSTRRVLLRDQKVALAEPDGGYC